MTNSDDSTDVSRTRSSAGRPPGERADKDRAALAPATIDARSTLTIPRYVVYFQVALLGITATTFFIFGVMVGSLTSRNRNETIPIFDCSVTGRVQFQSSGESFPDVGAVVFLLPKDRRPEERGAGNLVAPDSFQALNNPGIDILNQLGGSVVRADADGRFKVTIDASHDGIGYFVLVVSKNVRRPNQNDMTKQQVAVIGTFFMPVDRVVGEQAYYWTSLSARSETTDLGDIELP